MSLHELTLWLVLLMARATLILLAGAATVAVLRRGSASGRHAALVLTVVALLMAPLLSVVGPRWTLAVLPAPPPLAPVGEAQVPVFTERPRVEEPRGRDHAGGAGRVIPRASSTVVSAPPGEGRTPLLDVDEGTNHGALLSAGRIASVLYRLPILWMAGVALGALQIVRSALIVRKALRRATVVDDTAWRAALDDASAILGLRRRVRLLMSDAVSVPVVHGFADPAILVPPTSTQWPSDRRRAFLLHELAHVRRQDWLAQTTGQVVRSLYWPHPLAWWALRRLRAEAERACDDCVLLAGTPAPDYADHLLQAARDLTRPAPPVAVLAVVERSRFEDRLLALLDPHLRRTVPDRRVLGLGAVTALMFVIAVGGLQPATRAAGETVERRPNGDAAVERPPASLAAAAPSRPDRAPAIPDDSRVAVRVPAPVVAATVGGEVPDSPSPSEDASPAMDDVLAEEPPASPELPASSVPTPEPSAASAPARNLPVIRIATDLVQIDAVITDKDGRHVTDLRPEDFEVFQDGRKQVVSHVHYVVTGPNAGAAVGAPSSGAADGTEPRTLVFVVDDLGLSIQSAVRTRRLLEAFARSGLGPRDRAAIIETSTVGKTHQLTSDAAALGAAASAIRFRVASRAVLDRRPYGRLDETSLHSQSVMESLHALKRTIDALRWVPGRKAVILLSEGFTTWISRDDHRLLRHYMSTSVDALYGDTGLFAALRSLTDLANRASVVIYALDTVGVQPDLLSGSGGALRDITSWESRTDSGELTGRAAGYGTGSEVWREASAARTARQDSLIELAAQTGGLTITHNDLADGLGQILADHSGYYLIGYEPGRETFSGSARPRFHKVRVEVKRRGLDVRSRKGFYGVTDEVVAQAAPAPSP